MPASEDLLLQAVGEELGAFRHQHPHRDTREGFSDGGIVGMCVAVRSAEVSFVNEPPPVDHQKTAVLGGVLRVFECGCKPVEIDAAQTLDLFLRGRTPPAAFPVGGRVVVVREQSQNQARQKHVRCPYR
jgi:hypothetical protein